MTKTDEVRVLKKGTCLSLSGRSELTYEYGLHDKTILFHIADNSGSGHYSSAWISLDAILFLLEKAKEPFGLNVFRSVYPGLSINNVGFLGAVLVQEGLIICEKRQYLKKDPKSFLADINKLMKPAKKSPTKTAKTPRKPVKAEQKEEPT